MIVTNDNAAPVYDLSAITADLNRSADRLHFLCMNVPRCEKCNADQVQLTYHHDTPARWRCRICKHHFYKEPMTA
jgi:hypothetical protein